MKIFNYNSYIEEITSSGKTIKNCSVSPLDYQIENSLIKIKEFIQLGKPIIITRIGGSDFDFIIEYVKSKENGTLEYLLNSFRNYNLIYDFNGYFDTTDSLEEEEDNLAKFVDIYLESFKNSDLIQVANSELLDNMNFVYYEGNILKKNHKKEFNINLLDLFKNNTNCVFNSGEYINYLTCENKNFLNTIFPLFENKKILVISPFSEDIENQYKIKDKLYISGIYKNFEYPNFELKTLKTPITYSKYNERKNINYLGFKNWHECLDDLINKLKEIDFDIALLGCGSYTLPLLDNIKKLGKKGIYCGGILQIFFGILGSRYDYIKYTGIYNENWIYPDITKTDITTKNLKFYNNNDGIFAYTERK